MLFTCRILYGILTIVPIYNRFCNLSVVLCSRLTPPCARTFALTSRLPWGKKLLDPWDLATGPELWEALQYASGNGDPYDIKPQKRGPGTYDCPNIIQSKGEDRRIVGCICHMDQAYILYMTLHKGHPSRCRCGHWFKLVDQVEQQC